MVGLWKTIYRGLKQAKDATTFRHSFRIHNNSVRNAIVSSLSNSASMLKRSIAIHKNFDAAWLKLKRLVVSYWWNQKKYWHQPGQNCMDWNYWVRRTFSPNEVVAKDQGLLKEGPKDTRWKVTEIRVLQWQSYVKSNMQSRYAQCDKRSEEVCINNSWCSLD